MFSVNSKIPNLVITAFLLVFLFFPTNTIMAGVQEEIEARNKQIEDLQKQIDGYQNQVDGARTKSKTLENEISRLNAEINQVQLEIKSLNLSINKTSFEIEETEKQISGAEEEMGKHKNALAQYIKIANENDQISLAEILLKNNSISDFFNEINNINSTQDNLQGTIKNIKDLKIKLENRQSVLEEKQTELEQTRRLQQVEQKSLDLNKLSKNKLLKDTKGQETKFQELVKKTQKDIEAIKNQIGYLIQNGVSAEEAVKYAQLAAIAVNIRPAFLLAELEQESALGKNVGRCNITDTTSGSSRHITTGKVFARGIHPTRDLPLLLTITSGLGKDPLQTPISCWPGSGWGGAMGPAQFIPSTWVAYAAQVASLVGRTVANPWNIEDAFTAAAVKLARGGATSKTRAGEVAASKAYYCGNSKSTNSGCINYANSVQRKAAEIEKSL